nr:PREDICTED: RPII140-upstream gene protein [Bemisia tabaci]
MNRQALRVPVHFLALPFPFNYLDGDHDKPDFKGSITAEEYAEIDPKQKTGIEGLKRMWEFDELHGYSDEVRASLHGGFYTGILGGMIMGASRGKNDFSKWMRTNLASKFINEADAKKYLTDTVATGVFKGVMVEGTKIGAFVSAYLLASNSLSVYRGKTGMADFIVGGAFAGGAFRFWHGPRGFIVGIGLGSFLGTIAGGLYTLILMAYGVTPEEVKEYQISAINYRERALKKSIKQPWDESTQNAMLESRQYAKEKDLFTADPKS